MRNFGGFQFLISGLTCFAILSTGLEAEAFTEADLFPFDQRHLTYPEFKQDLDTISAYIAQRCTADPAAVAESLRTDYQEGCTFPKLVEELHTDTTTANADFASREVETRDFAQFIDLEYGWVLRTPFSLSKTSHITLLRLILVKTAMQMAVDHLSALWMATDLHGSAAGRMYTLPKFSAGLERDIILARTMRYASAMNCYVNQNQMEEACVHNRLELVLPLNEILNEFQSKPAVAVPLEIQKYADMSLSFRTQLQAWLLQHKTPSAILAAMDDPHEMKDLEQTYSTLIDLPKRVHNGEISAMAVRLNFHRYVNELKPLDPLCKDDSVKNEIELTPEVVAILAKIRKQLSVYY